MKNMNVPGVDTSFITEFPNKIADRLFCRDPFILLAGDDYFLYRTARERGVEALVSRDLENWSDPIPVFDSVPFGMNDECNWAPEVHAYHGKYYAFATFQQPNGRRGTYSLVSDNPLGPFVPNSDGPLTPPDSGCHVPIRVYVAPPKLSTLPFLISLSGSSEKT